MTRILLKLASGQIIFFFLKARRGIIAQWGEREIHIKFWLDKITLQQKSLMSPNLYINNLNIEFNLSNPSIYDKFRQVYWSRFTRTAHF